MPVTADHVIGHEESIRMQGLAHSREERLQLLYVVERLHGDDAHVLVMRIPLIQIESSEREVVSQTQALSRLHATIEDLRFHIETIKSEIADSGSRERLCNS